MTEKQLQASLAGNSAIIVVGALLGVMYEQLRVIGWVLILAALGAIIVSLVMRARNSKL